MMLPGVLRQPPEWQEYKQPRLFIRTTGVSSGTAYPWAEQYQDEPGVFSADPNGDTGTVTNYPAYMADGSRFVPIDTICEAVRHYGGWLIAWPITSCVCFDDGTGTGEECGGCATPPDCFTFTLAGITDGSPGDPCVPCDTVFNTTFTLTRTSVNEQMTGWDCVWSTGIFPIDACTGTQVAEIWFGFVPSTGKWTLYIFGAVGANIRTTYQADSGWNCFSSLVMNKVAEVTTVCTDWPATVVIDVCDTAGEPTVDINTADICADATTITITGTNFVTPATDNTVTLTDAGAANVTCTVASGTSTSLVLTLTAPPIANLGALECFVLNANGLSNTAQVATVIDCDEQIWFDTFTDTNGTALTAHAPDISPGGAVYTTPTNYNGAAASKFQIATNRLGETIGGVDVGAQTRFDPGLDSSRLTMDFVYNNTLLVDFNLVVGARLASLTAAEVVVGAYVLFDSGDSQIHIGAFDSGGSNDDVVSLTNGNTYTLVVETTATNITVSCNGVTVSYDTAEDFGETKWAISVDMASTEPANGYIFDNLEVTPWA